jgi:diguanylate cyclase (GGDEF)-like protein
VLLSVALVRDDDGRPLHLIVQVQDISARKRREARLEHLVDHDFLTMLYNGRRFEEALVQELKCSARDGDGGGAVLLLDVDHFKAVNDRFGHKTGDDLLKAVAATLRGRMRETDVLARLGGDEFGIILPRVDDAKAERSRMVS